MSIIEQNQRVKIFSSDNQKDPVGFAFPQDLTITGNSGVNNVLGRYSQVLLRYQNEPAPLPDNSLVLGDVGTHVYQFKPTGAFNINPESDVYDGLGVSDNWVDITLNNQLKISIKEKISFLWNKDVAPLLTHPVTMYGSDGRLYNSVENGNLEDDPTNGNIDNWLLFLDPSTGIIFPGFPVNLYVETVPNGYVGRYGQLLSKAGFPALYLHLQDGTGECIYGETSNEFRMPDSRGVVERGWDNGRGLDAASGGIIFTGNTTALSETIENLSTVTNMEIGMQLEGVGITPGTEIVDINYEDLELTMSLAASATGSPTIQGISRRDRGDGENGDRVGTLQMHTTKRLSLRQRIGSVVNDYVAGGPSPGRNSGTTTINTFLGGSNTETRGTNIYINPVMKT